MLATKCNEDCLHCIAACAASDDSDACHMLELIHSSSCEDDRKLWKIEENTNWLIKSLMFV